MSNSLSAVQDLMVSQWCCWGFGSAGMWHSVIGWVVPDVLKDHGAFIFRCQAVVRLGLLHPLVIGSLTLDIRHYNKN